jgi:hypothetical protein
MIVSVITLLLVLGFLIGLITSSLIALYHMKKFDFTPYRGDAKLTATISASIIPFLVWLIFYISSLL